MQVVFPLPAEPTKEMYKLELFKNSFKFSMASNCSFLN